MSRYLWHPFNVPSADDDSPTTMGGVIREIARVDPLPMLAPGQLFDQTYELVERLGGGGMGVVFRARDHRLGRDVALKVLRPSPGDHDRSRRLFEREARATAQLLHPNIVTLHHVGEHQGCPYLVLELLGGETLAARLARRGRLPLVEALEVLDSVLAALAFAHVRGVVHRDLKPSNVFITGDERIKVLDLGVSLSLGVQAGPTTLQAGTPNYMAPEQRAGGEQDARTDVWCAGLLLLECLLGRLPDEPKPSKLLRDLDAPPALRDVLTRTLATDPAERHASAEELQAALARAVDREPASAPRPRSLIAFVIVAIVAAVLGAGAMYLWMR